MKFALYSDEPQPRQLLRDQVQRMGASADEDGAAREVVARILKQLPQQASIAGVGHRVVHGGAKLLEHQIITDQVIAELKRTVPLDLAHLPREIALIEALQRKLPNVPQVACFDTAFHRDLPRVAQILPIPRRYSDEGVRRFGFHGLSYAYLIEELRRVAGAQAANGRVILAHLGSGASMVALREGKPIDTSMAFTPTAGLVARLRAGQPAPAEHRIILPNSPTRWVPDTVRVRPRDAVGSGRGGDGARRRVDGQRRRPGLVPADVGRRQRRRHQVLFERTVRRKPGRPDCQDQQEADEPAGNGDLRVAQQCPHDRRQLTTLLGSTQILHRTDLSHATASD